MCFLAPLQGPRSDIVPNISNKSSTSQGPVPEIGIPGSLQYSPETGSAGHGIKVGGDKLPRPGTGATGPGGRYANLYGQNPAGQQAISGDPLTAIESSGSVNYVPTDSLISITVVPVYSRNKISTQFNLKDFASGKLTKNKGFI